MRRWSVADPARVMSGITATAGPPDRMYLRLFLKTPCGRKTGRRSLQICVEEGDQPAFDRILGTDDRQVTILHEFLENSRSVPEPIN